MWCDSRLREEDNKLIKLHNIYADESNKCDNSISKRRLQSLSEIAGKTSKVVGRIPLLI